jgi:DNA invertase Pin-like site-specific DNA recombinase
MAHGKFVSYLRVSTAHQGADGLGVAAQRETVATFLNGGNWDIVAEFVEVESGRRSDRPELARALARCRATGAALVVANVSRLTRSVRFLAELLEAGVEVRFCDMPMIEGATGRFLLQQMASVAELEAGLIGERTRKALKASKKKLGGYRDGCEGRGRAVAVLGAHAASQQASARASDLSPIVAELRAAGITSLSGIAAELNSRGIRTPRGGQWHASSVRNVVARLGGGGLA